MLCPIFQERMKKMLEGSKTILKMKQVLIKGMKLDSKEYICEVISDSLQEQYLRLRVEQEVVTKISLDAKYTCIIKAEDGDISCDGMVKGRYQSEEGNVIDFHITNGFYKILAD